jgi:hypothetical protein
LNSFIQNFGFDLSLAQSKKFEYFSVFSLLSQEVNNNLDKDDLEKIVLDDGVKGLDAIAITINEKLIFNPEEIQNFELQSIIVNFYFFQSKTSSDFSDSESANFLDVVIDFFKDSPTYNLDFTDYKTYLEILEELKKVISRIREINVFCYYSTLGQQQNNLNSINSTINIKRDLIRNFNLFNNITIELVDKNLLLSKYKKAITPLQAEFKFENKITLSGTSDVDEAYMGLIPFGEFKKLIMDTDQNKIKSLFNDNLRDFLGFDNPVNKNIKKTLDNKKFSEFSLLNNGITVIAESNNGKGNTLVLENYQIVNGCQTSNVLYECRNIEGIDTVLIPLKVIITKNENLRDEIIITTNSQSSFTEEQLFAITQFQKNLEDYYHSQKTIDKIYYERRTNQYFSISVAKTSIIDIKEQLKSFMAMFFDIPHLVSGNIGKVINNYKGKFFQKEHDPMPYYLSGLLSKKWDQFVFSNIIYKEFNKFRYHIFMGFRYLVEDLPFDERFLKNKKGYSIKSGKDRINSFEKILNTLRDDSKLTNNLDKAIEIFKQVDYKRPKAAYSKPITEDYIKELQDFINNSSEE